MHLLLLIQVLTGITNFITSVDQIESKKTLHFFTHKNHLFAKCRIERPSVISDGLKKHLAYNYFIEITDYFLLSIYC